MLHNPVFTRDDVKLFKELVKLRCLDEDEKTEDRSKLGGRVKLFHEVISAGLRSVHDAELRASTR